MMTFILKQLKNRWHSLGIWIQIQLSILFVIVFAYLISTLGAKLSQLPISPMKLALAVLGICALLSIISAPFILKYAIPRQKTLQAFYGLPLDKKQLIWIMAYYYYSVQIPLLLFFCIAGGAVIHAYPLTGISLLLCSFFLNHLIFRFAVLIFNQFRNEIHLEIMYPPARHVYKKHANHHSFFASETGLISTLIKKELLGLWRNPHYKRLKIITFLFYLGGLATLYFSPVQNNDMWMMFFSAAIFWIHYNVHFNSKYVTPDPEWFFKSLPVPFSKVWISKFVSEILYISFLLIVQLIFLALTGNGVGILLNWIGALLLFAILILSIVINFQILFFDNPRQAGYTYHFTILFIAVTSLNYRLVGPLMALFLLGYYFYKTYRFYNS